MNNSIRFTKDQLIFLSNLIIKNSPEPDPHNSDVMFARVVRKDVASFVKGLSDPENMRRATQPGRLSE